MNVENESEDNNELYQHYCKKDLWSKREAIILLMGYNPDPDHPCCTFEEEAYGNIPPEDYLKYHYGQEPPLIYEYENYLDSLERAIVSRIIPTFEKKNESGSTDILLKPIDFIRWAENKGIAIHTKLNKLVKKYSENHDTDWKAEYKELKLELNDARTQIIELEEKPNGKDLNSYKKISKTCLELLFGHDTLCSIATALEANEGGGSGNKSLKITTDDDRKQNFAALYNFILEYSFEKQESNDNDRITIIYNKKNKSDFVSPDTLKTKIENFVNQDTLKSKIKNLFDEKSKNEYNKLIKK